MCDHKDPFRLNLPAFDLLNKKLDRRNFLVKTSLGLGTLALGTLFGKEALGKLGSLPKFAAFTFI